MSHYFNRYSEKSTASCTVNTLTMRCTWCLITSVGILRKPQLPTMSINWPSIALDVPSLQQVFWEKYSFLHCQYIDHALYLMSHYFSRYSEKTTASYTVNTLIIHCTWCSITSVGILRKAQLPTLSIHWSCIALDVPSLQQIFWEKHCFLHCQYIDHALHLMSHHFSTYSEKSTASCTFNTLTMHSTWCLITSIGILRKALLPALSINWPCVVLDVSILQ